MTMSVPLHTKVAAAPAGIETPVPPLHLTVTAYPPAVPLDTKYNLLLVGKTKLRAAVNVPVITMYMLRAVQEPPLVISKTVSAPSVMVWLV